MDTPNPSEISRNDVRTFLRVRPENPPWVRPALLTLLILTAVAYIWGLDKSGWANSFYSAAVQAATKSWKAFFFGSFDAANFITVDKPPASLWIMDLSARIFGLNSWSILIPEALEGVACVWVLYSTVRRWFSPLAALLAGAVLAMTPVAALMFRFNNPDALLVLLLTASAYALTRALEEGKTKWLMWASVLIGIGFLTKMLAAFLVIPGFVVVYLLFAPVPMRRRVVQVLMSALTVVVSAGWWVAIVQLIPAADRPYICSSTNNSLLNLIFGYNGLGRLTGSESGMGGMSGKTGDMFSRGAGMSGKTGDMFNMGAGVSGKTSHMFSMSGGMFGGGTGLTRLFQAEMGGQISWLIPAALILLTVAIWLVRGNWRNDRTLPALLIWSATLIVTGLTFSFGSGIIHQYYTVALAPAIGALVGIGTDVLWRRRDELVPRVGLAVATLVTAVWSFVLLDRTPTWLPWLRVCVLLIGSIAAIAIVFGPRLSRSLNVAGAVVALVAGLAGPFAYTIETVSTPHTGAIPTAGPDSGGGGFGGAGGFKGGNFPGGAGGFKGGNFPGGAGGSEGGNFPGGAGGFEGGNFPGGAGGFEGGNFPGGSRGNFPGGGFGNTNATPSKAIVSLLEKDAAHYTWVAATVGANSAAPYQLATGDPVMSIGGFLGSDPTPTLSEFENYVSEGKIHYFIAGGMGFGGGSKAMGGEFPGGKIGGGNFPGGMSGGSSSPSTAITQWVEKHFKTTKVAGVTVYDLTQPKS